MRSILAIFGILATVSLACGQREGNWHFIEARFGSASISLIDSTTLVSYEIDSTYPYIRSTDEGTTWSRIAVNPPFSFDPVVIYSVSRSHLFAFQFDSLTIIGSTDGGISWNVLFRIQDTISSIEMSMWNPSSGFILYADNHGKYHGIVTHDGCKSFTDLGHGNLFDSILQNDKKLSGTGALVIDWLDSLQGCLWCERNGERPCNTLLVTHNGGHDWSANKIFTPSGDTSVYLRGVRYSKNSGTYCLLSAYTEHPYFYFSTDRGDHWSISDTTNMPYSITWLAQASNTSFWAATRNQYSIARINVLVHTTDLGKHWVEDTLSLKDYNIQFIQFTDSAHGYIIAMKPETPDSSYLFRFTVGNAGVSLAGKQNIDNVFELYPNPAYRVINIACSEIVGEVRITDLIGNEVARFTRGGSTIDISRLTGGFYTLECLPINGKSLRKTFLKITP